MSDGSPVRRVILGLALFGSTLAASASGQTREEGPWWPHPIWGPDDRVGASNWITADKILEALSLAATGEVFELGHPYERGMPVFGARSYTLYIPGSPTYNEPFGANRLIGHDEFVCAEIGQVGTQFDGLGHIGTRLTLPDGSERDVFYNGVTVEEMRSAYGLRQLGVEHVKPIITRGVLVDVAGYKRVGTLPESYEITVEDVRGALARQGMSESDLRPGDAILFRYGWSVHWDNAARYNQNPPGIGLEVARWVVDRRASMVGSDSWTTEVVPNPDPALSFPVHQVLIPENGIHNLENMVLDEIAEAGVYEFLFIFTPLPLVGATGSPGRPLAIR
ncbi:MAG: cyclase family protein [Gemmatimonadales bacterium]